MSKTPDGKADPKDDRLSSFEVAIADLLFEAVEDCRGRIPGDIMAEDFVRFLLLTQINDGDKLRRTLSGWSPEKRERIRKVAVWAPQYPPEENFEKVTDMKARAERVIGVLKAMEGYHER